MTKKSIFSISVTTKLDKKVEENIRKSIIGSSSMKKTMQKVFQQANRRAQNIEKSGVASPAYQALILEGRQGYSKFSISGLDINNEQQWARAKYEYSKAIEYLNNPTSSATGARQYIKHLSKKYNKPINIVNNALLSGTQTSFIGDKLPIMNYKSMIDSYLRDSSNELDNINQNAEKLADELEKNVQNATDEVMNELQKASDIIQNSLENAFKFK